MQTRGWLFVLGALVACDMRKDEGERKVGEDADGTGEPEDTGVDTAADTGEDTGADTGDTGDTGDTADTAEAPVFGACGALLAPWPVEDGWDLMRAHRWLMPDITGIQGVVTAADAASATGCPTRTGSGSGFVITGGCTTGDGVRYEGRVTYTSDGSATTWTNATTFQDFEVWFGDEPGDGHFQANGSLGLSGVDADPVTGSPKTFSVTTDLHYGFEGPIGTLRVGEWAYRSAFTLTGESGITMDRGYVRVIRGEDTTDNLGDFCETITLADAGLACPTEGDGTVTVEGARTVSLALDGSLACDGCGALTIDGMAQGPFCGDWGGTAGDTGDTGDTAGDTAGDRAP